MALPASGQLKMSQIATEIYSSVGTNRTLRTMSVAASKPTTNADISNFYGYSHVQNITLAWGAVGSYGGDPYRAADRTNHVSPQIITINFNWHVSYTDDDFQWYSSVNSTSSWSLKYQNFGGGSSLSGSFTQVNVDYNDVIRIRWSQDSTLAFGQYVEFNGGTLTSGTPVVSVTGTGQWYP